MKLVRNNNTTEHEDNEIGTLQSFADLTPLPFLAVTQLPTTTAQKVCEIFQLSHVPSHHDGFSHLVGEKTKTTHKEKTVQLMGAAIYISLTNPDLKMLLSVENRLRISLRDSLKADQGSSETKDEQAQEWIKTANHLSLSAEVQLYLAQSGFNIQPQDSTAHLSQQDVKAQRDHLFDQVQTFDQAKKRA